MLYDATSVYGTTGSQVPVRTVLALFTALFFLGGR
jgi:hypothetical protein